MFVDLGSWPRLTVAALVLGSAACGGFEGSTSPGGVRLVTGQLEPPPASVLSRGQVALQVAAAQLDARESPALVGLVLGASFSPGANGGAPVRFRLALPVEHSHVLFFQVPVDGAGRLGQLVARVRFPRSSTGELGDLIGGRGSEVAVAGELDLGVVKISSARASQGGDLPASFVAVLGEEGSKNPLAQNDVDGDGVPDLDDADDDDDLIPDEGDPDDDGDDIPDDQQTLDALPDGDGDLIPDLFESTPAS